MKSVTQVVKETGLKRNQVMQLINASDSRWFRITAKGMWHIEESDLMRQLEKRKLRKI